MQPNNLHRIKSTLEGAQSREQAGFRSGVCCDDHLFTVRILSDWMNEFGRPLWICALDFRKVFDSVEHSSIWGVLRRHGVNNTYIQILAELYDRQCGKVAGKLVSKSFDIKRGTKQGDPLSPIYLMPSLKT